MNEQKVKRLKRAGKLMIIWGVLALTLVLAINPMFSAMNEGMEQIIEHPPQHQEAAKASTRFKSIMQTTVTLVEFCFWAYPVVCLLTGVWILQARHLTWCVIGAALVCVMVPVGTILGIWSLILLRDAELRSLFDQQDSELNSGAA
ncbi:hypothetical protein [Gimesia panareensis]|nr:hypothetical protein [Gimesia panareensis]